MIGLLAQYTFPIKAMSWNVLAGRNRWKKMALFHEVKSVALPVIRLSGATPIKNYPVRIIVNCRWRMLKRHDLDSIASAKPLLDSLVETGVLDDDDTTHVSSVTYTGRIGALQDEIIVSIYAA